MIGEAPPGWRANEPLTSCERWNHATTARRAPSPSEGEQRDTGNAQACEVALAHLFQSCNKPPRLSRGSAQAFPPADPRVQQTPAPSGPSCMPGLAAFLLARRKRACAFDLPRAALGLPAARSWRAPPRRKRACALNQPRSASGQSRGHGRKRACALDQPRSASGPFRGQELAGAAGPFCGRAAAVLRPRTPQQTPPLRAII